MSNFLAYNVSFVLYSYVTHDDWCLAVKGKKGDSISCKIYTVDSDALHERRDTS